MQSTEDAGRQASVEGFANEHIVAGLLMKRYQNVSLVDLPLSPYDIIIVRKIKGKGEDIIRAQVKTARSSVNLTGGSRGGVDREYKSNVKTYLQSPETSDVIIGLNPLKNGSFDMYFIPTILIESLGTKSKGLGKIQALKNNFEILERCKEKEWVLNKCKDYGII